MFIAKQPAMAIQRSTAPKWVTIGCMFALLLTAAVGEAECQRLLRIGTGGLTGVYYPIGKTIAKALTGDPARTEAVASGGHGVPGYIGVAQSSAGSVDNVNALVNGDLEAGLVQADVAAWAYTADRMFEASSEARAVRAVASLYPEKFQIVVRKDADIGSIQDLRGKRIAIDEVGSGTLAVMRVVLAAHGMSEKDLQAVYLKPVFTHDRIVSGELQGFAMMAGTPMEAIRQLWGAGISLIPVLPEVADRIQDQYPYLVPGTIAADVYPGLPEIPTIQVHALLVVHASMEDNLVHQITAALWSPRTLSMLKAGHPMGRAISLRSALAGLSIPLHPGAAAYYRERGLSIEGSQPK